MSYTDTRQPLKEPALKMPHLLRHLREHLLANVDQVQPYQKVPHRWIQAFGLLIQAFGLSIQAFNLSIQV